jgi:predicted metalloprotease with PDZ domain
MKGDLLWVYEGLTEYLGDVLAARCGIWSAPVYRDRLATIAAYLNDARPGRTWRDLQDTASAAQLLYAAGGPYDNWRRNVDYYDEGELLWLEVDSTIRQKTNGKKTLNDFVAAFHGLGGNTPPKVVPYTFDDVVAGLNKVVPNDWAAFLHKRLDSNELHAPEVAGINALSGYKLTYTDKPNYWSQLEEANGGINARWSLGLSAGTNGDIGDVIMNSVAYKAGLAPGFTIVAVNGRAFTPGLLRQAIKDAVSGPAIELIVANTGYYKIIKVDYHGGEKYPQLERVEGTPARLDDILQPMTK